MTVNDLECDEAVLTGESMPVLKSAAQVSGRQPLDQPGCAFMGTIVHQGSGAGIVVRTGASTEFGRIAAGVAEKHAQTAFEAGLSRFSRFLFGVAAVLTVFIFAINIALSRPFIDALLFSLAIAVGIAPEMMPAVVTVSLSAGSRVLAARNVLVKRLVAIEDLGNIEILFTDKTGTLTEGTAAFDRALDARGRNSAHTLLLGLICNEAAIGARGVVSGNALDEALWSAPAAAALGRAAEAYQKLDILPFDHARQLASVLVTVPDGERLIITKGAPEAVLGRCAGAGCRQPPGRRHAYPDRGSTAAAEPARIPGLRRPAEEGRRQCHHHPQAARHRG
jgi:Mg2+-importing ATPase